MLLHTILILTVTFPKKKKIVKQLSPMCNPSELKKMGTILIMAHSPIPEVYPT